MKYLYLLIKKCIINNKQYLCKRVAKCDRDAIRYTGSGKIVLRLKKKYNGCMQHVAILAKYPEGQLEEFSAVCRDYSKKFNIVESKEWLNLVEEDGYTGGAMPQNNSAGKKWMYRDNVRKRIKKEDIERYLSEGWIIGTPLQYRQQISMSLKSKDLTPWNKGKRIKAESEYKTKTIGKYVRKTEEEKFKNRSDSRKKLTSNSDYIAKFKTPRKPLLKLQNTNTGEVIEISRKTAREQYNLHSMHIKILLEGEKVKEYKLIT